MGRVKLPLATPAITRMSNPAAVAFIGVKNTPTMAASPAQYLGIDIGGTKEAAGLVTSSGRIVSAALEAVPAAARAAMGSQPMAGVGVSSPGPLDPRRGMVLNPPNLPCWRNFA